MKAGTAVVLGIAGVAAALAIFAVWFQWGQTRRCLEFFGPEIARLIQTAPSVELWRLEASPAGLRPAARRDVSRAAGLVHLRRGLIEDVNYRWSAGREREAPVSGTRESERVWDMALAFGTAADAEPAALIAFDLDEPASLTVVGRPGRVQLGPLGPGLRRWVDATWAAGQNAGFPGGKSGF